MARTNAKKTWRDCGFWPAMAVGCLIGLTTYGVLTPNNYESSAPDAALPTESSHSRKADRMSRALSGAKILHIPLHKEDTAFKEVARLSHTDILLQILDPEIRKEILRGHKLLRKGDIDAALTLFTRLVESHPQNAHCLFGRAMTIHQRAEGSTSSLNSTSSDLEQAVDGYELVMSLTDTTEEIGVEARRLLAHATLTLGQLEKSAAVLRPLIDGYPDNVGFKHQLIDVVLQMHEPDKQQQLNNLSDDILRLDPTDVVAQATYAFSFIELGGSLEEGVELLKKVDVTDLPNSQRWPHYSKLGYALLKLGRRDEAAAVFKKGAALGVFMSAIQRPGASVNGLTARPFWTIEQTGYADSLAAIAKEWRTIRDEGLQLLGFEGAFQPDRERLRLDGDWSKFQLYRNGRKNETNCELAPKTCALVARAAPDAVSCTSGQVKFSVLHGGTTVIPHCGTVNWRIRAHLGLQVPDGAHIRVANETRGWSEGKWLVLDDSFEHEVWHDGTQPRLILIVDFWHPEITDQQRLDAPSV